MILKCLIAGCVLAWGLSLLLFIILMIRVTWNERSQSHDNFNLTKEDFDFLIELQHEMLTQDTVCQAAPRFWVVAGTQKVPTGPDYADGEELMHDTEIIADGIEEAVEYFQELIQERAKDSDSTYIVLEKENTNSFNSWRVAKIEKDCNAETVEDYLEGEEIIVEYNCVTTISELVDALEETRLFKQGEYSVGDYRNEHYRYPNTMFLTNRSCKEHIEANHYHYSADAHSYAMTAWRSPEVEHLFKILDVIDWKTMRRDAYGTE